MKPDIQETVRSHRATFADGMCSREIVVVQLYTANDKDELVWDYPDIQWGSANYAGASMSSAIAFRDRLTAAIAHAETLIARVGKPLPPTPTGAK